MLAGSGALSFSLLQWFSLMGFLLHLLYHAQIVLYLYNTTTVLCFSAVYRPGMTHRLDADVANDVKLLQIPLDIFT